MKIKIILFSTVLLFASFISTAQQFNILFDFSKVTTNSGTVDSTTVLPVSHLNIRPFKAVGTPSNPNAGQRFSFTGWSGGGINGVNNYNQLTGTADTTEYYEVSFKPAPGYAFKITTVEFTVQRSGTGIRCFSVRTGQDGFKSNLEPAVNSANISIQTGKIFFWNNDNITAPQTGNVVSINNAYTKDSITLRFYAWNSESSSGTFSIDDVKVDGYVTPVVNAFFSANTVCEGSVTNFSDSTFIAAGNAVSYFWDFGDGTSSVSQNTQHAYLNCGTYNVVHKVINSTNDSSSITKIITVNCNPVTDFSYSDSVVCSGKCVLFNNTSSLTSGYIKKIKWNFIDENIIDSTSTTLSVCFLNTKFQTVILTAISDKNCSTDAIKTNIVLVNPSPTANFTLQNNQTTYVFSDSSFSAIPYSCHWDFGDGTFADSVISATHNYTVSGMYNVCLTVVDTNNCNDSVCKSVNVMINTGYISNETDPFYLFPVPVRDVLYVNGPVPEILEVYSIQGKRVLTSSEKYIEMSGLGSGMYFVKIYYNNTCYTKRIVKE